MSHYLINIITQNLKKCVSNFYQPVKLLIQFLKFDDT